MATKNDVREFLSFSQQHPPAHRPPQLERPFGMTRQEAICGLSEFPTTVKSSQEKIESDWKVVPKPPTLRMQDIAKRSTFHKHDFRLDPRKRTVPSVATHRSRNMTTSTIRIARGPPMCLYALLNKQGQATCGSVVSRKQGLRWTSI